MNCLPTSKCTEREFVTTKYIVSNCNVIEVTLTQKQNTDCTTEFVSLLDADGNSYPENSEFVSVNNQISRVMSDGNVVTMDVSGLIAYVLSKTKD